MTECLSCTATTDNGLALCERCQYAVKLHLDYLPTYFANLSRWRPGRAGSRQVPGSRVLYVGDRKTGSGDRISDACDEAATALVTWARVIADDRPGFERPLTLHDAVLTGDLSDDFADTLALDPARMVTLLCEALTQRLTSVATLEWAGEFVRELASHARRLEVLTVEVVPGWYAGGCRRRVRLATEGDAGLCGAPTYVIPGLTWVTCGACGSTTYARDHLEVVLNEARDWVAPPKRLAEAAVALLDTEQSIERLHKRISKWGERGPDYGGITSHRRADADGDPVGPKRYRLGDVLDRLFASGPTRLENPEPVKSAIA